MHRLCLAGLLVMTLAVMVGCGASFNPTGIGDKSGTWSGEIVDANDPAQTLAGLNFNVDKSAITGGTGFSPQGPFSVTGGTITSSALTLNFQGGGSLISTGPVTNNILGTTISGTGTFIPPNGGPPVNVNFTFNRQPNP